MEMPRSSCGTAENAACGKSVPNPSEDDTIRNLMFLSSERFRKIIKNPDAVREVNER